MTKDFKQLDYAIVVGEMGRFAVVEKDKKVFDIALSNNNPAQTGKNGNTTTNVLTICLMADAIMPDFLMSSAIFTLPALVNRRVSNSPFKPL
jgi:hypothetical protein